MHAAPFTAPLSDGEKDGRCVWQGSCDSTKRRAVLVFAESLELDLNRRRFPTFLTRLFDIGRFNCASTDADVHLFTSARGRRHAEFTTHRQLGETFAARLEASVEKLARLGYDQIVIVGRDCPHLRPTDITHAFDQLEQRRLVLGPDHRGGCYLIALRTQDRHCLHGVRWKRNTDFAQLRDRVSSGESFVLPVKHDLDSWADLTSLACAGDTLSAFFLRVFIPSNQKMELFVDLSAQRTRVRWQMPPPAVAA